MDMEAVAVARLAVRSSWSSEGLATMPAAARALRDDQWYSRDAPPSPFSDARHEEGRIPIVEEPRLRQNASPAMTSPPEIVPRARQIVPLMVLLTNRAPPSPSRTLIPPGW
jgi:hypothetical protein